MVAVVVTVAIVLVLAGFAFYLWTRFAPAMSPVSTRPPSPSNEVQVLPSKATSPGCIVGTPGVPRPTFQLQNGTLQANTYNVPSGTIGHVGMCYGGDGSLFGYANWSHVGSAGGWFSYPQVTDGVNFWDGAYSSYTPQSSLWAVPTTVSSVVGSDLWVTTNYSFRAPNASVTDGYDLSLDDFFTEHESPEFEIGASDPFVEVMVWFAHHITYPNHFLSWSTSTLVNSTVSVEPWSVGYWCHGAGNSTNANMSFDFSFEGQSSSGLSAATVGVNLSAILSEVEQLMPAVSCWSGPTGGFSSFYLEEANLGSEDGALGGTSYNYNWTIYQYCFHVGVGAPRSDNLSCRPPSSSTTVFALPAPYSGFICRRSETSPAGPPVRIAPGRSARIEVSARK
jgi:hypothetical protein